MPARKYPLEPLLRLKKERADGTVRQLGKAISEREEAELRRVEAEEARKHAEARAAGVRRDEHASLEKGELRAADLVRANAWEARVRSDDTERARVVEEATATLGTKRRHEADAQAKVAWARGEVTAIARHETRWNEDRRRERDAKEEEDAGDLPRPKPSS